MAMEESGKNTEKFLKEGFTVDGSSIKGMSTVEKSDLKVVPEADSFLEIKIDEFIHHRFWAHFADEHGKPHPRDPRNIF
jgi:glutamine synthetase